MLEFTDLPHDHVEPHPNRLALWLSQHVNRQLTLSSKRHQIKDVTVTGADPVKALADAGHKRFLFVANHSTHSDPQIIVEAQLQVGVHSLFMAAYDVFLRSRLDAWLMRRAGAFSIDRDSSDRQAMKDATQALVEGNYGLTIFPEGNVYFTNDRVNPFLEGASFIGMKAQKELGDSATIYIIPTAIKATHLSDQRETVRNMISQIAGSGTAASGHDLVAQLKKAGLRLLEEQLLIRRFPVDHLDASAVPESLAVSAEHVIADLEDRMEEQPKSGESQLDRVRRLRRKIHKIRMDPDSKASEPQADAWANQAMLALRILSYSGDYLDEKPTLDRIAETTEKLLEDMTSELQVPFAERHVYVNFAPPIALTEWLPDYNQQGRQTLEALTTHCEQAVQAGLDTINAVNPHPGGTLF